MLVSRLAKKRGLRINPDIHHSKVPSPVQTFYDPTRSRAIDKVYKFAIHKSESYIIHQMVFSNCSRTLSSVFGFRSVKC